MLTQFTIGSALVSSSFAALLSSSPSVSSPGPLITPGPQIELLRKQNDLQYIGYVSYQGAWTSEMCDIGNTYYQAGGQWACCATERAGCSNLAIGCVNGNMIYRATQTGSSSLTNSLITRACTSIWSASSDQSFSLCNTAFMYENDRDSNPKVNIICGVSSLNWSYYRQAPTGATSNSAVVSPLTSLLALPVPSRISAALTPTSTPRASASAIPGNAGGETKSKSKAWIAGAVIGPLLGLAIIGLAAFFFMRRKKNKSHNQTVAPATGSLPPPGATAYQQNAYPTNTGVHQPPQYYPDMQQNAGAAPLGVSKQQDTYYGPQGAGQQSPLASHAPQSQYGAPQQWQQPGGQPVYGAPSPSMSPQPQNVQPAQYMAGESRPFSSELQGSYHPSPDVSNVQPAK